MKNLLIPKCISELEKKKQLLVEIDIAIKDVVIVKVSFEDKTYTPKEFYNFGGINPHYEGENYPEQLKKYKNNKEKYGVFTFKIGKCTYAILNTKESLEQFKKAIIDKFPIVIKSKNKTFKKRTMNPTGKRVKGEDVAYYQNFKPRKQKIILGERNYYALGYFTNGSYMVKIEKPIKVKFNDIESSKIKDLLNNYNEAIPAKIVAEFRDMGTYESIVGKIHIVTENDKHYMLDASFVDVILTEHPNAKIFMVDKMAFFKVKEVIVGLIMILSKSYDNENKIGTLESLGEFVMVEYKARQLKKDTNIGTFGKLKL